jgi:hypothetical protein
MACKSSCSNLIELFLLEILAFAFTFFAAFAFKFLIFLIYEQSFRSLVAAGSRRSLRCGSGITRRHIAQQLHFHAAILFASFCRRIRCHFLILADADQVETMRGDPLLRSQVLHH